MSKKFAIITGATSGLGKEFAINFAKQGYNLFITGRREEILKSFAAEIEKLYNIKVIVSIGDLSDKNYLNYLCGSIKKLETVDYLVNNAGYGNRDSFFKDDFEIQEKMLSVHIYAFTKIVHVVGNMMKNQKFGNIINVSSLASFFPIPSGEFYCSTKAFINSFSESIYIDLREYNIKVQSLCPGFIFTDFHRKLNISDDKRKNKFLIRWMTPQNVVKISLKKIKLKDKVIVIPGFLNYFLYLISKLIPKFIYYKKANGSVKIPGQKK